MNNQANNNFQNDWLNVIRNGDSQRGIQIANNILSAYGLTQEQGMALAQQAATNPQFIMRAKRLLQS